MWAARKSRVDFSRPSLRSVIGDVERVSGGNRCSGRDRDPCGPGPGSSAAGGVCLALPRTSASASGLRTREPAPSSCADSSVRFGDLPPFSARLCPALSPTPAQSPHFQKQFLRKCSYKELASHAQKCPVRLKHSERTLPVLSKSSTSRGPGAGPPPVLCGWPPLSGLKSY